MTDEMTTTIKHEPDVREAFEEYYRYSRYPENDEFEANDLAWLFEKSPSGLDRYLRHKVNTGWEFYKAGWQAAQAALRVPSEQEIEAASYAMSFDELGYKDDCRYSFKKGIRWLLDWQAKQKTGG